MDEDFDTLFAPAKPKPSMPEPLQPLAVPVVLFGPALPAAQPDGVLLSDDKLEYLLRVFKLFPETIEDKLEAHDFFMRFGDDVGLHDTVCKKKDCRVHSTGRIGYLTPRRFRDFLNIYDSDFRASIRFAPAWEKLQPAWARKLEVEIEMDFRYKAFGFAYNQQILRSVIKRQSKGGGGVS